MTQWEGPHLAGLPRRRARLESVAKVQPRKHLFEEPTSWSRTLGGRLPDVLSGIRYEGRVRSTCAAASPTRSGESLPLNDYDRKRAPSVIHRRRTVPAKPLAGVPRARNHACAQVHRGDQSKARHEPRPSKAGSLERRAADGAFVEPRGCNRWQSAANGAAPKTAETSENRCRRLRPVACDVPW